MSGQQRVYEEILAHELTRQTMRRRKNQKRWVEGLVAGARIRIKDSSTFYPAKVTAVEQTEKGRVAWLLPMKTGCGE
jgi:hypothetical protein